MLAGGILKPVKHSLTICENTAPVKNYTFLETMPIFTRRLFTKDYSFLIKEFFNANKKIN